MIFGQCHLCDNSRDLVKSHIFPSFLYAKYISAISEGGRFYDLMADQFTNKQIKRNWFCKKCDNETLGGFERSGGELLAKVDADPKGTHAHDADFLAFIVSVAWRFLKTTLEDEADVSAEDRDVLRTWKRYLRGLERGIGGYSHHVFLVYDQTGNKMHGVMGGQYFRKEGVIHIQLGPLAVISFTKRRLRPLFELRNLDKSRVPSAAGTIKPLAKWVVGPSSDGNLPMDLAKLLAAHQQITFTLTAGSDVFRKDYERRRRRKKK